MARARPRNADSRGRVRRGTDEKFCLPPNFAFSESSFPSTTATTNSGRMPPWLPAFAAICRLPKNRQAALGARSSRGHATLSRTQLSEPAARGVFRFRIPHGAAQSGLGTHSFRKKNALRVGSTQHTLVSVDSARGARSPPEHATLGSRSPQGTPPSESTALGALTPRSTPLSERAALGARSSWST